MISGNLLGDVPDEIPEEIFQTLVASKQVKIERIISHGHSSEAGFWYDQDDNEWVLLLQGYARLAFENGDSRELHPGDFVNIPAHVRHRVDYTHGDQPTIWLAVFYR